MYFYTKLCRYRGRFGCATKHIPIDEPRGGYCVDRAKVALLRKGSRVLKIFISVFYVPLDFGLGGFFTPGGKIE